MTLSFNLLLREQGIEPKHVRLLRHQQSGSDGLTPFALWRDDPGEFERYQSAQRCDRRAYFNSKYWAGFVVPHDGGTLFVGLYEIGEPSQARADWIDPLHRVTPTMMRHALDIYRYRRLPEFDDVAGRLRIDWGAGKRSWAQRASSKSGDKPIVELSRVYREPDFPGFTRFIGNLGTLPSMPATWITAFRATRGVYLLTCPKTKEQYVGSAVGVDGFWGRWQSYVATGHGGNIGLRSRDPSDYQVSILEVAGSAATADEIVAVEQLWKAKLQSKDMGLNRN